MSNQEYYTQWAATHTLTTISFWWSSRNESGKCRLHDKTFNEALVIAKEFGFTEPKWYKPWTWNNGVVTVG